MFLTADRGKKRGVAKSARRPRSRFVGALEPLTHVRVAYFEKETRELVGLNYAEPVRSPLSALGARRSGYVELLRRADRRVGAGGRPERDAVPARRVGGRGDGRGMGVEPLARYFEYWLLRLQGVYPPHLVCHRCGEALHGPAGRGAWLAPSTAC